MEMHDIVIVGGGPAGMAAAVAAYDAIKLEITGSTFNGNYTNSSHGGAVYTQNCNGVICRTYIGKDSKQNN